MGMYQQHLYSITNDFTNRETYTVSYGLLLISNGFFSSCLL